MRLALISDTHDNFDHVRRAVEYLQATNIDVVLHAGDVTSSQMLLLFAEFNVWIAQGNMDNEKDLAGPATALFGEGRFAPMHDLEFDGCKLALLHGHDRQLLDGLIYAKHYDYVIRGHTHAPGDRRVQATRVLNPGAVGNTGWRTSSFGILDLKSGELDYVRL